MGIGQLTLLNYTPGTDIVAAEFGGFTYSSNLLGLTITKADLEGIGGDLTTLPGANDFNLEATPAADPNFIMFTESDGFWCIGNACEADYGSSHVWSVAAPPVVQVPEPWTAALLAASAAMVAMGRRLRGGLRGTAC